MYWGTTDLTLIRGWKRHHDVLPEVPLHLLPGLGHVPMVDDGDTVMTCIRRGAGVLTDPLPGHHRPATGSPTNRHRPHQTTTRSEHTKGRGNRLGSAPFSPYVALTMQRRSGHHRSYDEASNFFVFNRNFHVQLGHTAGALP